MGERNSWKKVVAAVVVAAIVVAIYLILQPPKVDTDGDGIVDVSDNCPAVANPKQEDIDGDRQGDACDPCPEVSAEEDRDLDCVGAADNCPEISNRNQADWDGDGVGDVCDDCPSVAGVEKCQDLFTESFAAPVTRWSLSERPEYTLCITRSADQPAAFVIGPRFDNVNLRLERCRVFGTGGDRGGDAGEPLELPKRYSMNRPIGIGCPDPEDPFIDVLHWKPGVEECVTVSLDLLYALDAEDLKVGPADTMVCDLSGRFVTKGIRDPGPPVREGDRDWDGTYDWCRDGKTGLIDITPVDQMAGTVPGVRFLMALPATIDVKPGSGDKVDTVDIGHSSAVPVAVLGGKGLDVALIDQPSIEVAGSGGEIRGRRSSKKEPRREDVNGDGHPDLLVHVDLDIGGTPGADGHLYLTFDLVDGTRGIGRDAIRLAGVSP